MPGPDFENLCLSLQWQYEQRLMELEETRAEAEMLHAENERLAEMEEEMRHQLRQWRLEAQEELKRQMAAKQERLGREREQARCVVP